MLQNIEALMKEREQLVGLKDKSGDSVYFFNCQQLPWKDQNQQKNDETNKYFLCHSLSLLS